MYLDGLKFLAVFGLTFTFLNADDYFLGERDVFFLLRIRDRSFINDEVFTLQNAEKVAQSAFDPTKSTTFLIHGYLEDRNVQHHLLLSK
jgi:hypothetical protein